MHFINKLYRYIRHFNVHISIIFRSYFSHSGSSTAAMNWLIFLLLRFCQYFPIPYFILIIFFLLVFSGSGFGCFSFSHSFLIVFRLFCFGSYESARWFALLYELLLVLPVHRANLLYVPLHFFSIDLFFVIVNTFYISYMWPLWVWTRFVLSLSGVSSGFFRCRWYISMQVILMPCNISESIYIENMEVELRDLRSFKQSNLHWNCLPESIIPRKDMLHMIKLIMILCVFLLLLLLLFVHSLFLLLLWMHNTNHNINL